MGKEELEESLNFPLNRNTILVTFHPVTMENNTAETQFIELLSAINYFKDLRVIFTMPNSDTDGKVIMSLIKVYVAQNPERTIWFTSLGMKRYLSVMQYIGAVVGNSSSGIVEVPSFHIPTLNIGDRQRGRIAASSVTNCLPVREDITEKLAVITQSNYIERLKDVVNQYDKPDTAREIVKIIKNKLNITAAKKFYDLTRDDL
jgi:UDP-N-acetylglucosamine 2-epimerase (non-hydrolysing)/GDP/UDP-N,N'-diacetylbacillosamine 2-epimerase (hydrolysing)